MDIWAIGITTYILSYNKLPFYSENNDIFELYEKIHKAEYTIPDYPKRSHHFKYFLKKCLEKDPNKRITSEKILDLKWLNFGTKENLKFQCKKVVKFIPTKDEIYKNLVFFSTYYMDVEKLKNDERPVVKKITNKILDKYPNLGGGKKIKIKIKIKSKEKDKKTEGQNNQEKKK